MKTKSQSVSLLEDVRSDVRAYRHGPAPWYERIPHEYVEELNAIRAAWKAGELGNRKKTLARSISTKLRARGISEVGEQGVIAWLDKT